MTDAFEPQGGNPQTDASRKNMEKLVSLLEHPWKLISQGRQFGLTTVKKFLPLMALFVFTNLILWISAIYFMLVTEFTISKLLFIILILLIGIGFTVYAGYRAYKMMILDALRVIYQNSETLFRKISSQIINKADELIKGRFEVNEQQLKQALDIGQLLQTYYQKAPRLLQKVFQRLLNKIPFAEMVQGLKTDLIQGNKEKASETLYVQIDQFVMTSIFGNNTFKWIYGVLALNIILQLLCIELKIDI